MKGKEVISAEEGAEKIRAAADARTDPDMVIMARTDALATHGIGEAIRRLNLYAEMGADLLFADAVLTTEHIATVTRNVSKPVCVNMGFGIRRRSTTPLLSARQLQDLGVAVVIYPRLLTAAAVKGMKNAMAALGESLRTGEVVASRDQSAGDFLITGDATNVAARLQQAAEPWSILVSDRTVPAAIDAVEFGDEIHVAAKGKSIPVSAREVLGPRKALRRRSVRGAGLGQ